MKNMISFITVNLLIVVFLIAAIHIKIFFLPLTFFVFLNKNSLGIILGYTEAHNDELITKEELDERINEEIQEIVSMIKDEIYK